MGFFSDLKEDLSQAVNELLPEEASELNADAATDEPEQTLSSLLDSLSDSSDEMSLDNVNLSDMLDKVEAMNLELPGEPVVEAEPVVEEVEEQMEVPMQEEIPVETIEAPVVADETSTVVEEEVAAPVEESFAPVEEVVAPAQEEEMVPDTVENIENTEEITMEDNTVMNDMEEKSERRVATDETAIITLGMTVRGDVETEGSMELIGKVIGNVDVLGKLNITGAIEGNSRASEIYAEKAHIIGEVVSDGTIKIGQNSVIIGNISGSSAVVAGAIKGDIDVKGPVILDSTAIVMGNIRSKSVQINNGAVIEGMCSQCYADVTPTSFFEEFKNI